MHVQSPPEARPDAYVRNSPLFHLDKVRAPVLIITGAAHWDDPNQARQAFSALRRLGKRVELRIYRDEGHLIFREPNVRDVSKRMLDWFDEHLRGREPDARR